MRYSSGPQRFSYAIHSSGMCCCINGHITTGISKNHSAYSFMVKQSNKDERLALKTKALWTCKMSGTARRPTTQNQTTFFCDTFMFCALTITLWQESSQLFHSTNSITVTPVLSPLADYHTYIFHSFPQHTQRISYYSFLSHLLSTNITQTLVKWKTENNEKNKYSNTTETTACWYTEIQRVQKALPVHKIYMAHEPALVNDAQFEVHYTLV